MFQSMYVRTIQRKSTPNQLRLMWRGYDLKVNYLCPTGKFIEYKNNASTITKNRTSFVHQKIYDWFT